MRKRTRTVRRGQVATSRPSFTAHDPKDRIQRELSQLPRDIQDLLARSHIASAAVVAVATTLSLAPGSYAWLAAGLITSYPWAVGYLLRLGVPRQDALDIAQAAMLAALSKWSTFDAARVVSGDPIRAWFKGFLTNVCLDRFRWRRTRREVPLELAPPESLAVPGHAGRAEAADLLQRFQSATTPERWAAWWAYEVEGHAAKSIARLQGTSKSKAEWLIRCARDDLDHLLRALVRKRRTRRTKSERGR